jgi:nucleotide-binding universal stress UspA family protein
MNILLAADGSVYTKRAARYVIQHASELARKPKIFLLHVHPPIPFPGAAATAGRKAVESYQREESEKALKVAEKELRKAGFDFKADWVVGDVAAEIKAHARKVGADVLVMGSHGHGAFASMALGSVASKVIASVKMPVLIVQ